MWVAFASCVCYSSRVVTDEPYCNERHLIHPSNLCIPPGPRLHPDSPRAQCRIMVVAVAVAAVGEATEGEEAAGAAAAAVVASAAEEDKGGVAVVAVAADGACVGSICRSGTE